MFFLSLQFLKTIQVTKGWLYYNYIIIKLNIKDFDTLLFVVTLQEIWSQYVTANN